MFLYRLNRPELMPCVLCNTVEFVDNPDVVIMQQDESLDRLIPSGIISRFDYPGKIAPHPTWTPKAQSTIIAPPVTTQVPAPTLTPVVDHVAEAARIMSGEAQVEGQAVESVDPAAEIDKMDPELKEQMLNYIKDKAKTGK